MIFYKYKYVQSIFSLLAFVVVSLGFFFFFQALTASHMNRHKDETSLQKTADKKKIVFTNVNSVL